ncbi:MAG: glucose-6-phosphate isomerase [Geobacteraceae bacterium]
MDTLELWERYKKNLNCYPELGLLLDVSRMDFPDDYFKTMEPFMLQAYRDMAELEDGALANPDEGRMVGHYWLRTPYLAPTKEISRDIEETREAIKDFAARVHRGEIAPQQGGRFSRLLLIGIGGSALGPQFIADALSVADDAMTPFFFDNTDPDGMDRVLEKIGDHLAETLTLVISKSGGTKETRNGMLEANLAYERAGLDFSRHAVAVTGAASELDRLATEQGWLARFPMWDWVGGRTSVTSAVGLLPAALQGIDIDAFLEGASNCDILTRMPSNHTNPAARLALVWYRATGGVGSKDMVVLPYKDRLLLFSRYLQQLLMESLGKEKDLSGAVVHQGLSVYGNKGSTDQHAFVQQLRDGVDNFFVTFVEVLHDREGASPSMEAGVTSGDYLSGFLQGTRKALYENGRQSLTITLDRVDARSVGALIALFERAVGFYASLIGINAYHQPGVEAGKRAANSVLQLQQLALDCLRASGEKALTAEEVALEIGATDEVESVFRILLHAAANEDHGIRMERRKIYTSSRFRAVDRKD